MVIGDHKMSILFSIADVVGTVAFALSGFLVASRNDLDFLGIFIISFLTALGGGIVRDVIVGLEPISFVNYLPTLLVLGVIMAAIYLKLYKMPTIENRFYFILSDTVGLVSFAITGALVALGSGYNLFGVMFLALITAVGGGVMRDILLNQVPFFLKSEFYGSVALLTGLLVYFFDERSVYAVSVIFVFGVGLRLTAYYKEWHLPRLK
jgi:uncharacterized membrane protein YeiH